METILHFIAAIAPSFFLGTIGAFIALKLLSVWTRNEFEKCGKILSELTNVNEVLAQDVSRIGNEVDAAKKHCETCTRDDAIGCPTGHLDDEIAELGNRSVKYVKTVEKIRRTIKLVQFIYQSPLGKIFLFLGNSDSFPKRKPL